MNKVILRVKGGIGNQLFMYAAAKSFAIKNNCELVVDHNSGFEKDFVFNRRYHLNNFSITARTAFKNEQYNINRKLLRFIQREFSLKIFKSLYPDELDLLLCKKDNKDYFLEGYWQSENYFIDVSEAIRSEFKFNCILYGKNKNYLDYIKNTENSVAVHIRFNDNGITSEPNLSDYYKKGIEYFNENFLKPEFFIFSNNIIFAKQLIGSQPGKYIYIEGNDTEASSIFDLVLMSSCNNFIIANSTFSWWGAWLSMNEFKKILYPDINRFSNDSFWRQKDLIPKNWIPL